ncbi:hypothetical protein EC844_11282 [Acinetobacter calcoaceticus]|uniref:Uncharacterized protein n=1 Tax=Acinetobacter calcoaceticus TaxID=471 RepID=A0A4R1XSU6_ACICA|nr:hypothetical protein EC844_11282 [Acinetobacter calcoaceticus]
MAQAKKVNPKLILWVVLPSIFLIAMLGFKFIAVKSDLENKREIDELIRKQQALRPVKAEQQAASALSTTEAVASAATVNPQSNQVAVVGQ